MFVFVVYLLLFFAIYIAYFSPDQSKDGSSNSTTNNSSNYNQTNYMNKVNNNTSRSLNNFDPRFKNDIIVPDNAKKSAQRKSTQSKDAAVISVDQQRDIYYGIKEPPMMLGMSSESKKSYGSTRQMTASEMSKEEKSIKDKELENKVALAKERMNNILGKK